MSHHSPKRSHCQNCGTELKGPYCHHCGQHDFDAHSSFGHAVHEVLESFFHWDGKFFRGVHDLLFRPGYLTLEYNSGRRASQIPPLRFYIFVSLLFFLAPSGSEQGSASEVDVRNTSESTASEAASSKPVVFHSAKDAPAEADAKAAEVEVNVSDAAVERYLKDKLAHKDEVMENFHHYLPRAILVCLPLFALMTMAVFRKSGYSFLQHLVFSMHLHTFFFLFSLTWGGWRLLAGLVSPAASTILYLVGALYIVVYAYLSLRTVFGGARRRGTILRGCFLLGSYAFTVGLVMLMTVAIAAVAA